MPFPHSYDPLVWISRCPFMVGAGAGAVRRCGRCRKRGSGRDYFRERRRRRRIRLRLWYRPTGGGGAVVRRVLPILGTFLGTLLVWLHGRAKHNHLAEQIEPEWRAERDGERGQQVSQKRNDDEPGTAAKTRQARPRFGLGSICPSHRLIQAPQIGHD